MPKKTAKRTAGGSRRASPPLEAVQRPQDGEAIFRLQMKVTDLVLGYWRQGLGVIGVVLGVSLVYGLWNSHVESTSRRASAEIAAVDAKVPDFEQAALLGLPSAGDTQDAKRLQALEGAARGYEEIGRKYSGVGSAQAWIKAADTWTRLGRHQEALAAWSRALDAFDVGVVGYAARMGLAAARVATDDVQGALQVYQEAADRYDGVMAEQALVELARTARAHDDDAAASSAILALRQRFPDSQALSELAPGEQAVAAGP